MRLSNVETYKMWSHVLSANNRPYFTWMYKYRVINYISKRCNFNRINGKKYCNLFI